MATQAEDKFVNQYTRKLLTEWASTQVRNGCLAPAFDADTVNPFVDHAIEKGWLSKRTPRSVTAKGFTTAAGFLKR